MWEEIVNLEKYSPLELILFGTAGAAWVVVYSAVIRGIFKHKFVEIPAAAVILNFGWEIVWGFFYRTDFGPLFQSGYRVWFALDLIIVWGLYKYGYKQVQGAPYRAKFFRPLVTLGIVSWTALLYLLVAEGYDTPQGLNSGFVTTIVSSTTYIVLFAHYPDWRVFSRTVVWATPVAIGFAGAFSLLALRDNPMLLTLWGATWACTFIYVIVYERRRSAALAAA
jgi:hypothetical protein